jgi:hypothetical protein
MPTNMRSSWRWIFASALAFMASTRAQTTGDSVASFISEAYSVYTEVTSILASITQNTATSTSSTRTSSRTSFSTSPTRSITSVSARSSLRLTSSASLAAAAATSSAPPTSATGGRHHNTLAIALGSVLGALALGLLLLVFVLICHHRRHKTRSPRAVSLADEDIDSWRGNNGHGLPQTGLLGTHATSGMDHSMAIAAAPDMAQHPAFRNSHENPFVPVPPPPRRTAPNSRAGLTDGMAPGQEPFLSGKGRPIGGVGGTSGPLPPRHRNYNHHEGEALAAGLGGAALGAAVMHHHNRDFDSDPASEKRYSGNRHSLARKPVPDATQMGNGSDTAVLNRATDSPTLSPLDSAGLHRSHSQEALLSGSAAIGAGALGGAAVADHHKHHGHDTDTGFFNNHDASTSAPRTTTPLVPPILTQSLRQRDAMPPEYDMISNNDNDNRNSRPTSGMALAAALGPRRDNRNVSPIVQHGNNHHHTRNSTPPAVPSRSPRRTRFSDVPYDPTSQVLTPPFHPVSSTDLDSNNSSQSSDDSAFRLGSSIPGGWRRDSADSDHHLRNSGINQHGRRSNSPRTGARDFAVRDSGFNGVGARPVTAAGARRHSPVISPGIGPGARRHSQSPGRITGELVRLSDLRAEEEHMERERRRGRKYGGMTSEWAGGDGYDGYERGGYGVGQAL